MKFILKDLHPPSESKLKKTALELVASNYKVSIDSWTILTQTDAYEQQAKKFPSVCEPCFAVCLF